MPCPCIKCIRHWLTNITLISRPWACTTLVSTSICTPTQQPKHSSIVTAFTSEEKKLIPPKSPIFVPLFFFASSFNHEWRFCWEIYSICYFKNVLKNYFKKILCKIYCQILLSLQNFYLVRFLARFFFTIMKIFYLKKMVYYKLTVNIQTCLRA